MFDILSIIPGKKRLTQSGWYSFNAICCMHRGHRPDKRQRGGIKKDGDTWAYACFNCNFKCVFVLGKPFSYKTKLLLKWAGVDELEINKWNLSSIQNKDFLIQQYITRQRKRIHFDKCILPIAEPIDPDNVSHKPFIDYLQNRNIDIHAYPYMVTPNSMGRLKNRIIIPYLYKNIVVGYTSKFLDNGIPKYINHQPSGFVFGMDFQKPNWEFCILVEGIFDALSIDGCALTHNSINEDQAALLSTLNRKIIYVPDQDHSGLELCDRALELGYYVSIPNWENCKDVNDAVCKYGRLITLLSIIQSATTSRIKIEMRRKKLDKRI